MGQGTANIRERGCSSCLPGTRSASLCIPGFFHEVQSPQQFQAASSAKQGGYRTLVHWHHFFSPKITLRSEGLTYVPMHFQGAWWVPENVTGTSSWSLWIA